MLNRHKLCLKFDSGIRSVFRRMKTFLSSLAAKTAGFEGAVCSSSCVTVHSILIPVGHGLVDSKSVVL